MQQLKNLDIVVRRFICLVKRYELVLFNDLKTTFVWRWGYAFTQDIFWHRV